MKTIYSMNADWKFRKAEQVQFDAGGDNDFNMFSGYTKTGTMIGAASDSFSDADWKTVSLPHDWLVEEPFVEEGVQGFKPKGAAWYRKCFRVPSEWDGRRVFLRFDGIACRSVITLNNVRIAVSESTYTPISAEVTDILNYGQPNQLAVLTDNKQSEGWWYDGCGIYRDVWLTVTDESRIVENGAFLYAQKLAEGWRLNARVEIDRVESDARVVLSCEALNMSVECAASALTSLEAVVYPEFIWSLNEPHLYDVSVRLIKSDGTLMDEEIIPFGFRTVEFDVNRGCILNGEPIKLKGVCIHHDHAGVGVAITDDLNEYRIRRLKEMGCNAIRTSHNPQSPSFYRACDKLGIAVMAETRHFGSAAEELHQLRTMIRRDRCHPSVFFWSLFNEEPLQCSRAGEKIARSMKHVVDEEDGTRPVSGGMNGPLECEGAVNVVDVMGFNYLQYGYDDFHKWFPNMPIVGSETGSHLTGRGEWRNIVTETELHRAAFGRQKFMPGERAVNLYSWSDTPGGTWKKIVERPFVAGGYYWTGFDYRGEANWPGVIADFGAMDICGFPKDNYYWHQALWLDKDVLYAHRYPREDSEKGWLVIHSNADLISVQVGENTPEVFEFDRFAPPVLTVPMDEDIIVTAYRNGVKTAQKKLNTYSILERLRFDCEHGEFDINQLNWSVLTDEEAVITAYRNWLQTVQKTSNIYSIPDRLRFECASEAVIAGGATVFNVYMEDKYGQLCDVSDEVEFMILSGGSILGVGNGDSCSHESERSDKCKLYHGCAQVIVRAENAPILSICSTSREFFKTLNLPIQKTAWEMIPSCQPWMRICPWRMSDVHDTYPIPSQIHDMIYNWIPTMAGVKKSLMMSGKHGYACFAGFFSAPQSGGKIHLENIQGMFDLYLDGKKIMECRDHEKHTYVLPVSEEMCGKRCALSLVFTCDGGEICVGETYLTDEE